MTSNTETAQLLERVGAVFRVLEGDSFRSKAYFNAATVILNLAEPIGELYSQNRLDDIPGIGEGLKKYISEYITKGRVHHFETMFKKVPAGMFPLMNIRGIGPITAYKIAKKFHLNDQKTAIKDLKILIAEKKLTEISGFKEKTATKIEKAIRVRAGGKKRMLLSEALPIAEDIVQYLSKSPLILDSQPLGSLRRKVSTIGDIDIAISSSKPAEAMQYALKYPQISAVITRGDAVSHIKLKSGYEVDIKCSLPAQWGSLLQHYTGSKMHNIKLRTISQPKHLSLSEYGIKRQEHLHKFTTETAFYQYLGLQYIPPELREDKGEIETAIKKDIPKLVTIDQIKGDLHIHSDFDYQSSHDIGSSSLFDIFDHANKLGYQYLGLSDHNPKYTDLSEKDKEKILSKRKEYLLKQFHAYENKVKKRSIKLLIGMEVDIRPDGKRALSDRLMNTLDYAIVSIHSSFEMSKKDNTQRILDGLDHPKAVILGHPTGRKINQREPIQVDWDKVFEYCFNHKKIIEINSDPARLDLPDGLIKEALKYGVKFILNTDSHHVSSMDFMKYGVWQARRGWACASDIINTQSLRGLQSVLNL